MFRTRLAGAALLTLALMPGCACWHDRPGLLTRFRAWRDGPTATPVAMPVGDPGCNDCGAANGGGPIIVHPGGVLPQPGEAPKIPRVGIDESKGKQFELEGMNKGGPVLTMPAAGSKGK